MEEIHSRHPIFESIKKCFESLLYYGILPEHINCPKCSHISNLKIYKEKNNERVLYRCSKKSCQKKANVLNTRIPINDYLFIFYKLLTGHT